MPIFEELDDATITVRLKVPAEVQSNQLKMHSDANSLRVELRGEPTALTGKLYALVKPRETIWELERSKRPEYDPMLDATEQPLPDDDTMCITLYKRGAGSMADALLGRRRKAVRAAAASAESRE